MSKAPLYSTLSERYGVDGAIVFEEGPEGTTRAVLTRGEDRCAVSIDGGHVVEYVVDGQNLLWVSSTTRYPPKKAIRGGVPVCWPWFAGHPTDDSKPSHGFLRTSSWAVLSGRNTEDYVELVLERTDDDQTKKLFPYAFSARLIVRLDSALTIALEIENRAQSSFTWTGALHTYFRVSDVRHVSIEGLDGAAYFDKLDDNREKTLDGKLTFNGPMDAVFVDTTKTTTIKDSAARRNISIEKTGSQSTVVWNPWEETAKGMSDLDDEGWPHFICVEAANALHNIVEVEPGARSIMSTRLSAASP